MTDRIEALRKLKSRLEAGSGEYSFRDLRTAGFHNHSRLFVEANVNGSLDAARALHEAVLPGWHWQAWYGVAGYTAVLDGPEVSTEEITQDNPARAWLTAILSALISQAEQSQ